MVKKVQIIPSYVDKFATVPMFTVLFIEQYIVKNSINPVLIIILKSKIVGLMSLVLILEILCKMRSIMN